MNTTTDRVKRIAARVLVALSFVGVLLSYYSAWVLLAYFAAGLSLLPSLALFFTGPLAGLAAIVALLRPRQIWAAVCALSSLVAWLLLWLLMFLAGFRYVGDGNA